MTQHDEPRNWICLDCPLNENETCGPWQEGSEIFTNCKRIHQDHPGWNIFSDEISNKLSVSQNYFQDMVDTVTTLISSAEIQTESRENVKGPSIKQIENFLDSIVAYDHSLTGKILRVGLSAYSNDPINIGIMAPSSEGKTFAAVKTCDIFPKNDVIFVGRMSPSALVHDKGILVDENNVPIDERIKQLSMMSPKEKKAEIRELLSNSKKVIDLSGKIMVFMDAPNQELWDRLKPILSHDRYEIEFKTTDKPFGKLQTVNTIIRGWPACIFCSAKNEKHSDIWAEIETRFVITNPNMNAEKYKKANQLTGLSKGLPDFARGLMYDKEDEKYAKYYVEEIKNKIKRLSIDNKNPIWNPFHKIISDVFPSNEGITMRHYKRFTSFCNIETLINSDNNFKIEFHTKSGEKKFYVITSLQDIENAINIVGNNSSIPDDKLKFINNILEPSLRERLDGGVTTEILAERYTTVYGKPTTPKKILETYLYPLYDYGLIDYRVNPEDKRQRLYRMVSKPSDNTFDYIKSKIIEESKKVPWFIWTSILELEKSSIKEGRIHAILDPEGNPIGHNLLQKELLGEDLESKNSTDDLT